MLRVPCPVICLHRSISSPQARVCSRDENSLSPMTRAPSPEPKCSSDVSFSSQPHVLQRDKDRRQNKDYDDRLLNWELFKGMMWRKDHERTSTKDLRVGDYRDWSAQVFLKTNQGFYFWSFRIQIIFDLRSVCCFYRK